MNPKSLLPALLALLVGAAGGWWAARRETPGATSGAASSPSAAAGAPESARPPDRRTISQAPDDLAERLRELLAQPANRRGRRLGEILAGLDSTLTPAHLETARRLLPRELFVQFRWMLVERWAEEEPLAV
ncbi:MAG: hypothetical protein KIT22_12690, partial [Verrucomicrobiae bacterium]|nr:hypothetical protein [Verrucomicrobiae bacterium]